MPAKKLTTNSVRRRETTDPVATAPVRQRVLAWLIDCGGILGWLALTVVIGSVLRQVGVRPGPVGTNVVATVFGVAPVCIALAAFESGPGQATPGKGRRRLVVVSTHQHRRIGRGRALVRNVLKVGLPWTLGHALAIALVDGAALTPGVVVLAALAYAVPTCYLATLLTRPHRPLYDRLSGTTVVQSPTEATYRAQTRTGDRPVTR